jgi:hypothetical protein
MERPQAEIQTKQRDITAEIVYLDEMRRRNEVPKPFLELGDMAIQMYETEAATFADGKRPDIMDEYEQHDRKPSKVVASCTLLADELLKLKEPNSRLTFVDIAVEASPDTVLAKLQEIAAGEILAGADEQLAIPSNGEYYPVLDMRKQKARLVGVGLRVWGWDHDKYVFTNKKGEAYKYPEHALIYPSDEKSASRQIQLGFSYRDEESGGFSESVSLHVSSDGSASISSTIWASAYAETGYEGHGGSSLRNPTSHKIAVFGDLVAEIVGDNPESISMQINRHLDELASATASSSARQAVQDLIEATWPAQASYLLNRSMAGTDKTIAQQLCEEVTANAATTTVYAIIKKWNEKK